MNNSDFKSIVWKEGDQYVSRCLDVEVSSHGKTREDALEMLREALELYFEDAPIPDTAERVQDPIIASVKLQHA